jgi:hypothetical protein
MLRSRALSFSSSMYPALGKLNFLACRGRAGRRAAGGGVWVEMRLAANSLGGGAHGKAEGLSRQAGAPNTQESLPACLPHLVRCRHLVGGVEGAPDHRDVSHQRHVRLVAVGGQVVIAQPATDGGDDLDLQQTGGGEGGRQRSALRAGGRAADMGQAETVRGRPPMLLISLTRGLLYGSVPALFWMPNVCAGRWSS